MGNLEMIKEVRNQTGCSLHDAKMAVEQASGNKEEAMKLVRNKMAEQADRSPSDGAGSWRLRAHMAIQSLPGIIGKIVIIGERVTTCCISKVQGPCALVTVFTDEGEVMGAPVAWNCLRKVHDNLDMIMFFAMTKAELGKV